MSATLQVGATQSFTATGHYSDGSSASVAVTWTATGGTVSSDGAYTAGTVAGTYQVVATEQGGSISKAASVTVTAAPPVLISITVLPSPIALAPAATQQFVATGHYSGGSTGTVAVTWTATGGTIDAAGLFTAGSGAGPWQVTATQIGGSMLGTAAVTITPAPPALTSITVAPASITLIPTATAQFTATAHYSDNSTGTIPVDWTATGGAVSGDGFYTAGATDGSYQVTATATGGTVSGSASRHDRDASSEPRRDRDLTEHSRPPQAKDYSPVHGNRAAERRWHDAGRDRLDDDECPSSGNCALQRDRR